MTFDRLTNSGKSWVRTGFFSAFTLILLLAIFASTPAVADPPVAITQCGTVISQPGHYFLANDLSCFDQDGVDIVADHVDLMLNNHQISNVFQDFFGQGISVGIGVPSGNSHVHIIGPGTITGFEGGIRFEQVSFSSVEDVTSTFNFFGFVVNGGFAVGCNQSCPSTKNSFQGNTATFNDQHGFTTNGATDNTFRDNNASNNSAGGGILLFEASNNDVRANTTNGNGGAGIGVSVGTGNSIFLNISQNNGTFDLEDDNTNCDSDTWKNNTFGSANQSCIH
jgi:parallel beta-helix repeat protein